ncbi:DUF4843 domain-containing protein [Sphingobacterium sp. DR205]|uniref:DUF4843 domain-containing protein n=1 Tax=Sphingobacterium sp. DR205 TaxID=2713573 RepID=UPI0013E47E5C|nr:DUF4843 domain-containing protein [Sphingobacterium sp. DR205]QIH35917.1 DUF4843 domain-containing protein [Sphingobacterium sp. DR205]
MNLIKYLAFAIILCHLFSCEKVAVSNNLEDSYVEFYYPNSWPSNGYLTTINYNFNGTKDLDTIMLDLRTRGLVPEKDAVVVLKQIKEQTLPTNYVHAVPSLHFIPFDDSQLSKSYIIAKGMTEGKVPLILKKDPLMIGKTIQLSIGVGESPDFKPGVINYSKIKVLVTTN